MIEFIIWKYSPILSQTGNLKTFPKITLFQFVLETGLSMTVNMLVAVHIKVVLRLNKIKNVLSVKPEIL